jgi:hypothetical protein
MTDARATDDNAELVCVRSALAQLRLEHGNHPCYDAIEDAIAASIRTISQLRGALRAVAVIADDVLN